GVALLPVVNERGVGRKPRDLFGDLRRVIDVVAAEHEQRDLAASNLIAAHAEGEVRAVQVVAKAGERLARYVRSGSGELFRPAVEHLVKHFLVFGGQSDWLLEHSGGHAFRRVRGETQAER